MEVGKGEGLRFNGSHPAVFVFLFFLFILVKDRGTEWCSIFQAECKGGYVCLLAGGRLKQNTRMHKLNRHSACGTPKAESCMGSYSRTGSIWCV